MGGCKVVMLLWRFVAMLDKLGVLWRFAALREDEVGRAIVCGETGVTLWRRVERENGPVISWRGALVL